MKKLIIPISITAIINLLIIIGSLYHILSFNPIIIISASICLMALICYLLVYTYICKRDFQEKVYSLDIEMELNRAFLRDISIKNEIILSLRETNSDLIKEKDILSSALISPSGKKMN